MLFISLVKSQPFNETVNICHTPVVRKCGNESFGPDICSTHYETNCETRYKTYEVEQDEPVCKMVTERKCKEIQGDDKDYYDDIDKVNRCLARYSPRTTTTNQPTNRAPNEPAMSGPK